MIQTGILKYRENSIHVTRMGQGKELLFAFHDFNHGVELFKPIANEFSKKYTIIAIDLPGFGQSEWKDKVIDKEALVTIIERFKLEFKVDKFDILAQGLGSLFALTLIEQRAEWIRKVLLFDPEGMRRASWMRIATKHFMTKNRVKKAAEFPEQREKIINQLAGWGLLKRDWIPEMDSYLSDSKVRETWNIIFPLFRRLVPEIQRVRYLVHKNEVHLQLFVSDHKLTLKKDSFKFAKKQKTVFLDFTTPEERAAPNWWKNTVLDFFKQEDN